MNNVKSLKFVIALSFLFLAFNVFAMDDKVFCTDNGKQFFEGEVVQKSFRCQNINGKIDFVEDYTTYSSKCESRFMPDCLKEASKTYPTYKECYNKNAHYLVPRNPNVEMIQCRELPGYSDCAGACMPFGNRILYAYCKQQTELKCKSTSKEPSPVPTTK